MPLPIDGKLLLGALLAAVPAVGGAAWGHENPGAAAPATSGSDSTARLPTDLPGYDEVGYATWYGDELAGKRTASGEMFRPAAITAAHRTLPMPSYVEVTALDTGRTILVRVNDRGPFQKDLLIDLSRGAAEQLGIKGRGRAAVRVRRVDPPAQEKAALSEGGRAAARLDAPDLLLAALRKKMAGPAPNAGSVTDTATPSLDYASPPLDEGVSGPK